MNVINETITERFALYNADTVEVARGLPDHSVDFSVFSPPFASLYTYSNSPRDMGNVRNDGEFFAHYAFLIRETARVMKPGRLVAIHCMVMPTSKARDGVIGLRDFRGDIIRAYEKCQLDEPCIRSRNHERCEHGFTYHSEVCIWKNPVTAMQRTHALGLLYKTLRTDSAKSRQGLADYLVVMRAPGANVVPVTKHENDFPVERWQRYASPVWASGLAVEEENRAFLEKSGIATSAGVDDEGFLIVGDKETADESSGIDPTNTLQHTSAREEDDERHICPLQLGVIRRAVNLWSNPNDVVWSPFAGIGSEGYVALQEGRRFVGAELKASYYQQAAKNLLEAETVKQGGLFDGFGVAR